jgi:hypothetical protein
VFTGFPVKSAIVSSVRIPQGAELVVDVDFGIDDGFYVMYSGMPEKNSPVKFSYQAS